MKLKVIAFGIARDIIGGKEMTLDLSKGASVLEAMKSLKQQFPAFEELASLQLAVNEEYVANDYPIQEGDELVLIPPVSGG